MIKYVFAILCLSILSVGCSTSSSSDDASNNDPTVGTFTGIDGFLANGTDTAFVGEFTKTESGFAMYVKTQSGLDRTRCRMEFRNYVNGRYIDIELKFPGKSVGDFTMGSDENSSCFFESNSKKYSASKGSIKVLEYGEEDEYCTVSFNGVFVNGTDKIALNGKVNFIVF